MGYKTPKDVAKAGIATGATKAKLSWDKALVAGFLAGAYIGIAGLLAIVVSAGMPKEWGGLPTFITGGVFSLGLILVVIAGSELVTGNMALVPLAAMKGRASLAKLAENWAFVRGAYWFLYAREIHEEPGDTPSGAEERPERREPVGAR